MNLQPVEQLLCVLIAEIEIRNWPILQLWVEGESGLLLDLLGTVVDRSLLSSSSGGMTWSSTFIPVGLSISAAVLMRTSGLISTRRQRFIDDQLTCDQRTMEQFVRYLQVHFDSYLVPLQGRTALSDPYVPFAVNDKIELSVDHHIISSAVKDPILLLLRRPTSSTLTVSLMRSCVSRTKPSRAHTSGFTTALENVAIDC